VTALYINGALTQRYETGVLQPGSTQRFEYRAPEIATGTKISIVADFNADVQEFSEENNRLNYR
jgi:subtilase family serine protease